MSNLFLLWLGFLSYKAYTHRKGVLYAIVGIIFYVAWFYAH